MNRPNHTERPWHVRSRPEGVNSFLVCNPEGWVLLESKMPGGSTDEQNARLAAAAPQLAEALIEAIKDRAFTSAFNAGYLLEDCHAHAKKHWRSCASQEEKNALTAAGYLNNENE